MLRIKRDRDIIEVKETLLSWSETTIRYWYYNLKTCMKSATGKKDALLNFPMDQGSIDWVKKYYLPRAS